MNFQLWTEQVHSIWICLARLVVVCADDHQAVLHSFELLRFKLVANQIHLFCCFTICLWVVAWEQEIVIYHDWECFVWWREHWFNAKIFVYPVLIIFSRLYCVGFWSFCWNPTKTLLSTMILRFFQIKHLNPYAWFAPLVKKQLEAFILMNENFFNYFLFFFTVISWEKQRIFHEVLGLADWLTTLINWPNADHCNISAWGNFIFQINVIRLFEKVVFGGFLLMKSSQMVICKAFTT